MGNRRTAFTLVELLVVIAILAILAAFLFPVMATAKKAVGQVSVSRNVSQVNMATAIYRDDHDDTYPLAMYWDNDGLRTWFGKMTTQGGEYDNDGAIIGAYLKAVLKEDNALQAEKYLGDINGIGYNWGVIGSNFHTKMDYSMFPNCEGAARGSEIENPSDTFVFATSSYYFAEWLPGGDGRRYLFGFFDPLSLWNGNPNLDFRHMGTTVVDRANQTVEMEGNAIVGRADGGVRNYRLGEVEERHFWRYWVED